MENNLYKLIVEAQKGNKDSCITLIDQFNPIVKKYSKKLGYDGADTDLIIWLIKTINKINKRR
ncbi:hypothetical protein [Lutispora saccharofermentans]|uniref:Helix-turn-helix conjugative transposon-like domain-containing protein n=1 Tax=Lutispora saccharofermentans TaxID=3024236 RepID=A0ABT1NC48_9FIRM|nr:hypothetical protein [Lutispora saccharofermentans]MCQ1528835.1 hypothetical protein [Lutispora saccharofermentans]